jgi:L-ascorbate metabolism protein UlaG (beta-lactamase superfamily)
MRITYIGHATLLIDVAGRRLLTDPNFEGTLGRFLPRVSAPGIPLADLPQIDAILLTHAHADHLSFEALDVLPRTIPIYAPPAVAAWLVRLGYSHAVPLSPTDDAQVGEIRISTAVAAHAGSRYAVDRWRSGTNMYLIDDGASSCFFAGDTGLTPDTHRLVADRIGPAGRRLDVALLPIGHAPWWKKSSFRRGHLTSDDALSLFERLDARFFVPYHWGTFHHLTSRAFDAVNRLRTLLPEHARRDDVRILEPGETLSLADESRTVTVEPGEVPG